LAPLSVAGDKRTARRLGAWIVFADESGTSSGRRAIAVDGKALSGSRTTDTAARHLMAACDQISDLRDTVITADALRFQPEHVAYLAERGAHWILTVKGNQPRPHQQLAAFPWQAVPDANRSTDRGHGRREIRTLKILTISTGIDFPHATQALQIRRRRHRIDEPKRFTTETVYAITDLRIHQAQPAQLAGWIRRHWSIENKIHWVRDVVTYDEDRSQIRTGNGPEITAALRNTAIGALHTAAITNIAAGARHHARDSSRPLTLLGII
jgi:predicted transposase YbfD/YdcC